MARKSSTATVTAINTASVVTGRRHISDNGTEYSSNVKPVELTVINRDYAITLDAANYAAACKIIGVDPATGQSTVDPVALDNWTEVARDHVAYVRRGERDSLNRGMFAYGEYVGASGSDADGFNAAGDHSVKYLPLLRINSVAVKNGAATLVDTFVIQATARTFFQRKDARRSVPAYHNVRGVVIAVGESGKEYPNVQSARAVSLILSFAGLTATVRRVLADMLDRVAPFVADYTGNYPQHSANPVPTVTPAASRVGVVDPVAIATALRAAGITDQNVIAQAVIAAMRDYAPSVAPSPVTFNHKTDNAAAQLPSVTDSDVRPINRDTAEVVKEPRKRKNGSNAATKTITVADTKYVIAINADTAKVTEAITAANNPGKKSRTVNQLIAEFLPDAWRNKAGETGEERRNRAALEVAKLKN